jgi:hypothetical protein
MNRETGGPAFPVHPDVNTVQDIAWIGMTLRDYFAAKAMQAMITNDVIHSVAMREASKAGIPEEFAVAQMSFMVADAMLKARNQ